jgi:diguanylate cyclase (GGDEF)-like protein
VLKLNDREIQEFICNETSYFALNIIDLNTKEIVYANKAMKKIMVDIDAKKCWQSIYGLNDRCSWCQADDLQKIAQNNSKNNNPIHEFEHFNEYANKWYKIQKKITKLEDGRDVMITIMVDITAQKESQGKLISTQVKLTQQADKLKEAQKELKRLASVDPMTNLYNRRYFLEASEHMLALAKRKKENISTIILDIDRFKRINDRYGHKIGDDVIILLAKKLLEHTRKSDIVSRFGGEEFVILLPNTDIDGALTIAEKIRTIVEKLNINISDDKMLNFTVSIGVSEVDLEKDIDTEVSVNRADKALYEAKNSGRNRVCRYI